MKATATASPSLALIKYWGKRQDGVNIPATSSLAVSLGAVSTTTTVTDLPAGGDDVVTINGESTDAGRVSPVVESFRSGMHRPLLITSTNDFPTSAGLASSSSGFAALTLALDAFFEARRPTRELSAIARIGSGSAARAVYGGFTQWLAGSEFAEEYADAKHWPELRVIMVILSAGSKPTSSRQGMENARLSSPFYQQWVESSDDLFSAGKAALGNRNLEGLGESMNRSYLQMFSTMFTSEPPLIYWIPESIAVIRECARLRAAGVPVWETMDAGPQVKLVVETSELRTVEEAIGKVVPGATLITSSTGYAPEITVEQE